MLECYIAGSAISAKLHISRPVSDHDQTASEMKFTIGHSEG